MSVDDRSQERELEPDARVVAELDDLGISEVLHFTTNIGLTGILGDARVLSHALLPQSKHLSAVYPPNASVRYDQDWIDHVNLSISRINERFFGASERWHAAEDRWWCVLSFDPVVAAHPGVHFATTNNRYTGCRRASGVAGLRALWADAIHLYTQNGAPHYMRRGSGCAPNWPTCRQAEVLYPRWLSTRFLRCIYVINESHCDIAEVATELVDHPAVPIEVRPDVFS